MNHSNQTPAFSHGESSPLAGLPLNKTAQFLFGLVIIFAAAKLWWAGWFSSGIMQATGTTPNQLDGFGNPIGLLPFVLDSVCFVGILGFTFVSFVRGLFGPLLSGFRGWTVDTIQRQTAQSSDTDNPAQASSVRRQIDPGKLKQILEDFKTRLSLLEQLHPEILPPDPPTMESLLSEIQQLKLRLNQQTPSPQSTGKANSAAEDRQS